MKNTKNKILLGSAGSALAAAAVSITATVLSNDHVLARSLACAGYLVLLSIGLFFVGLAYPKK